jgi:pimeloyl-ACP methyl ester carboxylesterase
MTEGYIQVFDTNIYYKILHKRKLQQGMPLIVMLHEGLGSTAMWKEFPEVLSQSTGLPVLLYDRYGYGLSQALSGAFRDDFIEHEGERVFAEVIRLLGIQNPLIVFGHSDGGSVALVAASVCKKVMAVVVEAPHVFIEQHSVKGLLAARDAWQNPKFRQNLTKYHGHQAEALFKAWIGKWLQPVSIHWDIYSYLPGIQVPLLFIQGHDDQFGTAAQWEETSKRVQGAAEFLYLENCGHIPHLQAQQLVIEAVSNFIALVQKSL